MDRNFKTFTKYTVAARGNIIKPSVIRVCLGLLAVCLMMPGHRAQAEQKLQKTAPTTALTIALPNQHQHLALADLLRHPAARTITIPFDVSYKRSMQYRALPLRSILRDVHTFDTIQFKAKDGFVATMPTKVLSGAAEPWLALEPPNARWPALTPNGDSAGPFYLVWLTAEGGAIKPEQWPYQIVSISAVLPLEQRYPQIRPDPALPADSAEYRGMQSYIQQCASCHQINHGGDANIGPDLNLPFNPTEYFQPEYLRLYIRDPASVRAWPQMRMPAFSPSALDDTQLNDLLAYLRHMRSRKAPTTAVSTAIKSKSDATVNTKENSKDAGKNPQAEPAQ